MLSRSYSINLNCEGAIWRRGARHRPGEGPRLLLYRLHPWGRYVPPVWDLSWPGRKRGQLGKFGNFFQFLLVRLLMFLLCQIRKHRQNFPRFRKRGKYFPIFRKRGKVCLCFRMWHRRNTKSRTSKNWKKISEIFLVFRAVRVFALADLS